MGGAPVSRRGATRPPTTAPRRSIAFLGALGLALLASLGALAYAAALRSVVSAEGEATRKRLVVELGLTDLCLFTDARYTRHPSLADHHTPFQDSPLSFEHFPSGALLPPPPHLRGARP